MPYFRPYGKYCFSPKINCMYIPRFKGKPATIDTSLSMEVLVS